MFFSEHEARCTGKLSRPLHLPEWTPAALEATTILATMLAQTVRADSETARIADEPAPILGQHLPAVLAGDEIVGHKPTFPIAS